MSYTVRLKAPNGQEWDQPTGLFIDNEFVDASKSSPIISVDPATEKEIATVQGASLDDVDRAVNAARKALKSPAWKQLCVTERGRLMAKLADLLEANKKLLATVDAWDNGKHCLCERGQR
jgi:aldehyde dehydrogenase (NAD+)